MNLRHLAAFALLAAACGTGSPTEAPAKLFEPPSMPLRGQAKTASKPHPHLTYRGGGLVASAQYTNIYWGPYWATTGGMVDVNHFDAFIKTMAASARFLSVTQEYAQPYMPIGPGSFRTRLLIDTAPAAQIKDSDVRALIHQKLDAGAIPAADTNQIYVVYLPPDVVIDNGVGELSCSKFCGYHSVFMTSSSTQVQYIVMPHPDCWGCRFALLHDGIDMDDLNRDSTTIVLSHEMIETITDPWPGSGWYDDANGEISDICGGSDGYFDQGLLLGFRVQKHWSNADDKCQLERDIPVPSTGGCPADTHQQGSICAPDFPATCSSAGPVPPLAVLLAALALLRRRRMN